MTWATYLATSLLSAAIYVTLALNGPPVEGRGPILAAISTFSAVAIMAAIAGLSRLL